MDDYIIITFKDFLGVFFKSISSFAKNIEFLW